MTPQLSFTLPKKFFLSERKAFLEEFPSGVKAYVLLKFRKFYPTRLKGQKLLAQGSALGYYGRKPVALKGQKL